MTPDELVVSVLEEHRVDFVELAACKGHPSELWFPQHGTGYTEARAICAGCPVKIECGEQAMRDEADAGKAYRFGMFGGMSPNERYLRSKDALENIRTCVVCERDFARPPSARNKLCSERCTKIYYAEYHRAYQQANRNNGKPNPIAKHGTTRLVNAGCKCAVCTNRRRQLRRMARMRADVREEGVA